MLLICRKHILQVNSAIKHVQFQVLSRFFDFKDFSSSNASRILKITVFEVLVNIFLLLKLSNDMYDFLLNNLIACTIQFSKLHAVKKIFNKTE